MNEDEIIEILTQGGVGVIATDTIYGLVGSAFLPEAVERIYSIKQRSSEKQFIVLIHSLEDIERFGVELSDKLISQISNYWPGPYSIILPCIDEEFEYLARGTDSIAFRIPDNVDLRNLLEKTGPLIAPSANVEGLPYAKTIAEAQRYFGTSVDFYLDDGERTENPSSIIRITENGVEIIRP